MSQHDRDAFDRDRQFVWRIMALIIKLCLWLIALLFGGYLLAIGWGVFQTVTHVPEVRAKPALVDCQPHFGRPDLGQQVQSCINPNNGEEIFVTSDGEYHYD